MQLGSSSLSLIIVCFLMIAALAVFGGGIAGTVILAKRKKVVPAVIVGVLSMFIAAFLFCLIVFLTIVGVIHGR